MTRDARGCRSSTVRPTGSIGALAVSPSDPQIVYAGSGEGLQRPDLAVGDGIYKSTDGGATWAILGLRDGQQIASMALDPANPNRLFVAVLGHPYGPNDERGVYRTLDGGATFTRVLYKNPNVGAFDVVHRSARYECRLCDALGRASSAVGDRRVVRDSRERRLQVDRRRNDVDAVSLGTPAAHRADRNRGRTEQLERRICLRRRQDARRRRRRPLSQRRRRRALHRSERRARNRAARRRPRLARRRSARSANRLSDEHVHLSVDRRRQDDDCAQGRSGRRRLSYRLDQSAQPENRRACQRSGRDDYRRRRPHLELVVQPTDGADVSRQCRRPLPVLGLRRSTGERFGLRSQPRQLGETTERDWHTVGAEEYGYVVPDPLHAGTFFGGKVESFDERTDADPRSLADRAAVANAIASVRTEPLAFDHFDRHRLYFGSNVVFATENGGQSWHADQPRPDASGRAGGVRILSSGPLPRTIRARRASRRRLRARAVLRARRNDLGRHRRRPRLDHARRRRALDERHAAERDGRWSKISQIDASRVDDNTAFVAVNRFRLDDLHPYVYITRDGGATWNALRRRFARVSRSTRYAQDSVEPNLLYAATENGVYVSFDGGAPLAIAAT